jgi:hypothetical protein
MGALIGATLVMAISGSAFAYLSANGLGSAAAAVSKLSAPTILAATPSTDGTVSLTWGAVSPPGTEAVNYYVSRDGGDPDGTCAAPAVPTAATGCVDSDLEAGTYVYTVTAVWRSWSATGSPASAKVTIGAGTHFTIEAATTTPAVGAADNLTITVEDSNGDTVTTYTGSHSLTFSGAGSSASGSAPTVANSSGTATAFGKATALTFTAGVAKVTSSKNGLMKIYRSRPASIAAGDGTIETDEPLQVTPISGAATKYTLTAATTTPAAGSADDLTITAVDTYGNAASAYAGTKSLTFSGASASPGGNPPTVSSSTGADIPFGTATAIDFDEGVASAAGVANGEMVLYKSGATNVKATDGTLTNSTALATTVAPAEASKLVLTGSTTTPVATGTSNLTTTVQDPYGNVVTTYTGLHDIVFSGAAASPSGSAPTVVDSAGAAVAFGAATALNFKAGVAAVASSKNGLMRLSLAGETGVSASDGTIATATPLALNVSVGAASKLGLASVTASAGSVGSPCFFTCPVTALGNGGTISANVSVTDGVGNTVSALGSGHAVKVTANGGAIAGTPLTIAATGPAVSSTRFTYTAPASGAFTNTVTAAVSAGTVYTSATATASK